MTLAVSADLFHFPRLMTLSLHRDHVTMDFLEFFERNTTHLRSLYTSSMISGDKTMLRALMMTILSLPRLHTCQLRLAIGTSSIPLTNAPKSPLQRLKLLGDKEICSMDRLSLLLASLPSLQSLHIIARQLRWNSNSSLPDLNVKTPVSTLTLKVQEFVIPLPLLLRFVSSVMPQLERLAIQCLFAQQDLSYMNHTEWNRFIASLRSLREVTLTIHRASALEETTWTKKCELLGKHFFKKSVALRIIEKH